jgi:molybdopterin converting factor small subunit
VTGSSLANALRALELECPGIGSRIHADDASLLPYVNLYIDGNDARLLGGVDAPLRDDSIIDVVPAVSGGA